MKLVFVSEPSAEVRFPIRFEVSEKYPDLPVIPSVVVYADNAFESPLPRGVKFCVNTPIIGCLQVRCNVYVDTAFPGDALRDCIYAEGVVEAAIKAALVEHDPIFKDVVIEAKYEITPLAEEELTSTSMLANHFRGMRRKSTL